MNENNEQRNERRSWITSVAQVFSREFKMVLRDEAVIIFFVVLSLVYPPLYSLIYNTETVRDEPVVVVDDSHSSLSREFIRLLDATPGVWVKSYARDMNEARDMMARKQCYGIYYFPADFESGVHEGRHGHVSLYCDMSVMMRYKAMLTSLTDVQMEMGSEIQGDKMAHIIDMGGGLVESRQVPLGNTAMGIASAVLPFILVYVLQQGMVMGIAMLHAGSMGRRRRNKGIDRYEVRALPGATILGRTVAHLVFYVMPVFFALYVVPLIFHFPLNGNFLHILIMSFPFLVATSFFGQAIRVFVNNREGVFLLIAFTSLIFVFLTGVSWPHFQAAPYWQAAGDMLPGYWASTAYVRMQIHGASLTQMGHYYGALWILSAVWFVIAYLVEILVLRPKYRAMQLEAELDPKALRRRMLYQQGDDDLLNPDLFDKEEED